MNHNVELLNHIYKNADMGVNACESMLTYLKEKDNKIKDTAEDILKEYEQFKESSKELLEKYDENYAETGFIGKMMSDMGIKKEVNADNSDSAMASMLIEGLTMGSINTEKKLKDYEKKIDGKVKDIAERFLEFHQRAIEKLEVYL